MLLHSLVSSSPRALTLSPVTHYRRRGGRAAAEIRCSSASSSRSPPPPSSSAISKVHSYGTVDYERRTALRWSSLYRRIATGESAGHRPGPLLDGWDEEERRIAKWELCRVAKELRKFRRFRLALEVYDWMTAQGDRFAFNSSDMAIQLDLIAKVHGISQAEEHFQKLPDILKDKRTYGALLNVYAQGKLKEKTEEIFEIMRNEGYADDTLPCNVMMTLYMNVGEHDNVKKIIDEMKERNVMFDVYSYNIWITNSAAMEDVEEMERVLGLMTADSNINANWTTYTTLASMYIRMGNFEKAQNCLKDAETRMTGRDRTPFHYLIGLYGNMGKKEEVYRIWKWYRATFPSILNLGYQTMLSSLIKLGDVNGAEMIYEEWISKTSNYDPKVCNILLGWYCREGLVDRAEQALDSLVEKGGKPKPNTWEILAEGYTKKKQISEALSCMEEAASYEGVSNWKPKLTNISDLLELFKEQSDTENADRLLDILRRRGCVEKEEYKSLISTYTLTNS